LPFKTKTLTLVFGVFRPKVTYVVGAQQRKVAPQCFKEEEIMSRRRKDYIPADIGDRTLNNAGKGIIGTCEKNFKPNARNAKALEGRTLVQRRAGCTLSQSKLLAEADAILKANAVPRKKTGRPRRECLREASGKVKRPTTSARKAELYSFYKAVHEYARERYPWIEDAVLDKAISPESGILAFYWLVLVDRGVRVSAEPDYHVDPGNPMLRAIRVTSFEIDTNEGAAAARAYVAKRLGTDAVAALDDAIINGEKTDWSNLQSLLGAFWSAMLEHGNSGKLKNYGAERHDWISHMGGRLKPEHYFSEHRNHDNSPLGHHYRDET
jgi:hypothetical protein